MGYWCPPQEEDGKYSVEYVGYPESRCVEEYIFDTEQEANKFYELQTKERPQND